jgi:hypothetical protein
MDESVVKTVRTMAGAAVLALTVGAVPAVAQTQTVLHSPEQIRGCLCGERSVSTLATEVQMRKRVYEEKKAELARLEAELAEKRRTMDVNDPAQVAAVGQLLDRRNAAADAFARQVTPTYAAAVERYNREVADFNGMCAGKSYDVQVLAQVRQNLTCPAAR